MLRHAVLLCVAGAAPCAGHGAMVEPPSWLDRNGSLGMGPNGLLAGCTGKQAPGQIQAAQGCACEWFSNYTFIPGEPTIPIHDPRTTVMTTGGPLPKDGSDDWTKKNPWRAPGQAPVFSPCGIDGGNPGGCPVGNKGAYPSCMEGGYGHGPDGRTLQGNVRPKQWKAGGTTEVGWRIAANHGGGYSYRLCKKPAGGFKDLTEECFQKTPLRFSGSTQWAQFYNGSRISWIALRTDQGTHPKGSQWTRNPIPGCYNNKTGPFTNGADGVCDGPQFPPPVPGLYGFGGDWRWQGKLALTIVDKVEVPAGISGDYVISWRYDCEQTSQVWNSCGDVHIN